MDRFENDAYDFSGSFRKRRGGNGGDSCWTGQRTDPPVLAEGQIQDDGIFTCALMHFPLFASMDFMPTTGSSGWLSFARPLAPDHVLLFEPTATTQIQSNGLGFSAGGGGGDSRTEVLCPISCCHLGHYFGSGEGYCINASVLNFVPLKTTTATTTANGIQRDTAESSGQRKEPKLLEGPVSYRRLERHRSDAWSSSSNPALRLLWRVVVQQVQTQSIILGAGCFCHVEMALRRLPGVVSTVVGYAGGVQAQNTDQNGGEFPRLGLPPSYTQVCDCNTGHAEVVWLEYDPQVLPCKVLLDCFCAINDPTKLRAHGKHATGTGQYRRCIFIPTTTSTCSTAQQDEASNHLKAMARQVLADCQQQLRKDVVTEVQVMMNQQEQPWFWRAEDRHQRHEERKWEKKESTSSPSSSLWQRFDTLDLGSWLDQYGRRKTSVLGSASTTTRWEP